MLLPVDIKDFDETLALGLTRWPGKWSSSSLKEGKGKWQLVGEQTDVPAPLGGGCYYCGREFPEYGPPPPRGFDAHEMDGLLLPRIDLTNAEEPVLSYSQRY